MLIQTIYVSTATRPLDDEQLQQILSTSVRNNAEKNVTGLLLLSRDTFMQALEGEGDVVDKLIARITQDTRHTNVAVVARSFIKQREFSRWHMGFHRLQADDARSQPHFAPFFEAGFDPTTLSRQPDMGLEIMRAWAEEMAQNGTAN